ncbi:MAG: hydroxymethylglutaryl-CoA lyase [Polyangiales bacterium]|nr:hydroxymethylglutaryl-CoA lyase [Myxococcales bacterium]MCB9659122.1 hydroxymethylglutaryl-CoA lyase [Sandaracinaceae bacterium]
MAIFDALPAAVSIYEVSPRDGLQNESAQVATHAKVRLIESLIEAGLRRIEVTSFVSAKWVPQMSDADQVCRMVEKPEGVCFSALVPNARGLDRALAGGIDEAAVFLSASETHNRKNVNKSVAATLTAFEDVISPALRAGMQVRGYVSTVWGCPYEGSVDPHAALRIAHELLSRGCYQVSLGDTIGVGTPLQTRRILEVFLKEIPAEKIALHLHDTRGTALANVLVGLEMGITTYDSSVGGLGGCPYAPGAAGNLATEDLAYTLAGMGIDTGLDLEKIWRAGQVAEGIVGRELPGKVHKAGIRSLAH